MLPNVRQEFEDGGRYPDSESPLQEKLPSNLQPIEAVWTASKWGDQRVGPHLLPSSGFWTTMSPQTRRKDQAVPGGFCNPYFAWTIERSYAPNSSKEEKEIHFIPSERFQKILTSLCNMSVEFLRVKKDCPN